MMNFQNEFEVRAEGYSPPRQIFGNSIGFKFDTWIPGNVPSLKNSKVATKKGVFPSKTVIKYLQKLGIKKYSVRNKTHENYVNRENIFEEKTTIMKEILSQRISLPHILGLYFIRDSKRKFDWINAAQIICDLLVAHGVIEEDHIDALIPMPVYILGRWYSVDKHEPGCRIYY